MNAKKESQDESTPPSGARRGRYLGVSGRRFETSPFGGAIIPVHGEIYDVPTDLKYLWEDPQFADLWEWDPK